MTKKIFYFALAVLATACMKENLSQNEAVTGDLTQMEFTTSVEATKTHLGADGVSVYFYKDDKVAVFDGTEEKKQFTVQEEGSVVTIMGEAVAEADAYYAMYPYSGSTMSADVFTATVSTQQNVKPGTMADNCAVIVAKAEEDCFNFKNMCALVKFNLDVEGVRSLTLMGNNNEQIAGKFTFTWNEGDPQITGVTAPQVAVSLRNSEGENLAKGNYYFTILPTEFTKGFSVILGMEGGTQKIVKRSAELTLAKNEIFSTQAVPAAAYKDYASNYVKYNDGFELTYAHLTINKAGNNNKYATYINDGNNKIPSAGVYFVGPESTNVDLAVLGTTGLVVAGDNPDMRSVILKQSKAIQAQEKEDGYIILSGLDIKSSPNQIILQQTEEKGGFANFGSIVIDNCKLSIKENMINCYNRDMSLANFVLQDSDVMINAVKEASYMFNCGSKTSTVASVKFTNNVFQNVAESETDILTTFKLVNGATGLTVGDLDITYNTLVGTTTGSKGYANVKAYSGNLTAANNFFVHTHTIDKMEILQAGSYDDAESLTIKSNYYYINDWNLRFWGATGYAEHLTKPTNPVPFVSYPLSGDWDPENGVFGYIDGLRYGSLNTKTDPYTVTDKGDVSKSHGAQR